MQRSTPRNLLLATSVIASIFLLTRPVAADLSHSQSASDITHTKVAQSGPPNGLPHRDILTGEFAKLGYKFDAPKSNKPRAAGYPVTWSQTAILETVTGYDVVSISTAKTLEQIAN